MFRLFTLIFAFLLSGNIAFATIDISLTNPASQTLVVSYKANSAYGAVPFNIWNSQVFTMRWSTALGQNVITGITNQSAFTFTLDGSPMNGSDGFFYQKFTAAATNVSQSIANGTTLAVLQINLFNANICSSDFELITGTSTVSSIFGTASANNALGEQFNAFSLALAENVLLNPSATLETWYADADNDGKGNPAFSQVDCAQPEGYVSNQLDCNDMNQNLPTTPATTCDDGNPNTINDVILANGCDCAGTLVDCPVLGLNFGATCNDNNPCTENDVVTVNCNCIGTFQDSDNDGVCNANDLCPGGSEPGTLCNDNDPTTINDMINVGCNCVGTPTNCSGIGDADGDGICTNVDCNDNNAQETSVVGSPCDDNDPCTINDGVTAGCGCAGTFQDTDNDGVCDAADCNDNNASLPATPGTACNDGNANTSNDVIQSDGCTCAGTLVSGSPCDNVVITTTANSISIGNISSGHYIIKLFGPSWNTIINCIDCAVPQVANGLAAGTYHVDVQLYNANWQSICTLLEDVQIGGTPCTDNDNDGVCAAADCNDNNASLPATPGTACNDGNANTSNDVIQSDGCTCAGTLVTGSPCDNVVITTTANSISIGNISSGHYIIKLFGPSWNTIINCIDCAVPQIANGLAAGTYHVDVQLYNANWQSICTLLEDVQIGGTPCTDNDNDGVCAAADCNDNNASLPATVGTACNDGDANTSNDVIQSDGCTCAGTLVSGSPCDNVVITTTANSISIGNISSAHYIIKLFGPSWNIIINCIDCAVPQVANGLAAGTYHVEVKLFNANWQSICTLSEDVQIGGTPCTDMDNDGVCAAADCNDNNASLPATPGTACNDGNANTSNDVIQSDSCTCAGSSQGAFCSLNYTISGNSISFTFANSPHYKIRLFDSAWQVIFQCLDNCATPQIINNLQPGTYQLDVLLFSASWATTCAHTETITILQNANINQENNEEVSNTGFAEIKLYPNPTEGVFYLQSTVGLGQSATIEVYNTLGQKVHEQFVDEIFINPIKLDLTGELNGHYYLTLRFADGRRYAKRLVLVAPY